MSNSIWVISEAGENNIVAAIPAKADLLKSLKKALCEHFVAEIVVPDTLPAQSKDCSYTINVQEEGEEHNISILITPAYTYEVY